MSQVMKQDISSIIEDDGIDFERLRGQTILLTGATGLIGKMLLWALICADEKYALNIKIIAVVRDCALARKKIQIGEKNNLIFIQQDIVNEIKITEPIDYIIHGASITKSLDFVKKPVETIKVAMRGSENLLELAKEKKVKSMVYLSSMEVYGKIEAEKNPISEAQYGYIDIGNVRSSYSEGKRMVECMCNAYKEEYQIPVKCVRLAQTFGAGVEYDDKRVFAEFARCLVEKRDIVLHTEGGTVRNYCYLSDAVRAILYVLLKGENGESYNVANEESVVSIRKMAEMIVAMSNDTIKLRYEIDDENLHGYNPEMVTILDTQKIVKLGWQASVSLEESYRRLIKHWEYTL